MDIHVNRALRHLDAEDGEREAHLRHKGAVDVVNRLCNRAVLDRASVDNVRLPRAAATDHRRLRDVARDTNFGIRIVKVKRNQSACHIASIDALDRMAQTVVPRR